MNKNILLLLSVGVLISQVFSNSIDKNRWKNNRQVYKNVHESRKSFDTEDELINFIEQTMLLSQIPGLSISIAKNESIVWEKHFGYANIDDAIQVSDSTMFIISSISKTVTATALMELFEQGMFKLNDDIDGYLAFEGNPAHYPSSPITFKMLLTHTSGIKDNWGVMPYYDGDPELELGYYLEQYLTVGGQFYGSDSNFPNNVPGSSYSYSNIAVALIGLLVEEISGERFSPVSYTHLRAHETLR